MSESPTVLIRNTMAGPTVFTSPSGHQVEWKGAGDPHGGDLQPCPGSLLEDVQFQNAMVRGIFLKETFDPEALNAHREEWEANEARRRNASLDALEEVSDKDLHMVTCVMPVGRANSGATCDVAVPMSAAAQREKPPLCPEHSGEAAKFISDETDKMINGKPVVKWSRIQMTRRTTKH